MEQQASEQRNHCALCLKPAQLRRSHIIPEFFYSSLYEVTQGRTLTTRSAIHRRRNEVRQKGYYERLLCGPCESKISQWERYMSHLWYGKTPAKTRIENMLAHVEGIDYHKLKLFQLSVLWRAGVSTLPIFEKVNLGHHEKRLRAMLLAADPGDWNNYPCVLTWLNLDGRPLNDLIVEPTPCRGLVHGWAYTFVFGGFLWSFQLAGVPKAKQAFVVSTNGSLTMVIRDALQIGYLRDAIARVVRADEASDS